MKKFKFKRKTTSKVIIYNSEIEYVVFTLYILTSKNNHYLISKLVHIQIFTGFNIFGTNLNYQQKWHL